MIIVTDGQKAIMYYSNSQWLDASDLIPKEYWAFQVPNTTPNPLGGMVAGTDVDKQAQEMQAPMTHAEVEAISTELLRQPEAQ